jgi:hypothetical protein
MVFNDSTGAVSVTSSFLVSGTNGDLTDTTVNPAGTVTVALPP